MAYFYIKHKSTHTIKEVFELNGTDVEIQKAVREKQDNYDSKHECVNVSKTRYEELLVASK